MKKKSAGRRPKIDAGVERASFASGVDKASEAAAARCKGRAPAGRTRRKTRRVVGATGASPAQAGCIDEAQLALLAAMGC